MSISMYSGVGITTQVRISSYAKTDRGEKAWACRIGMDRGTYEIKREFIESRTENQAHYHGQAEGSRHYGAEDIQIDYDFSEREGTILEWTNSGERHLAIVDKDEWNGVFELDMLFPGVWDDIKSYLRGIINATELKEIRDAHRAYMRRIGFKGA